MTAHVARKDARGAVFCESFEPPLPPDLTAEQYYPLIPEPEAPPALDPTTGLPTLTPEMLARVMQLMDAEWRAAQEAQAARHFSDTRTEMMIRADLIFWAMAALHLEWAPLWTIPTAATDGRHMFCNPEWWNGLKPAHRLTVLAHEIMHNILHDHTRRGARDPLRFNLAADVRANEILRAAGFIFPDEPNDPEGDEGGDGDGKGNGATAKQRGGKRRGKGCGGGYFSIGDVLDAPKDGKPGGSEGEWQVIADQAMGAARARGRVPVGMKHALGLAQSRVNWLNVLREFLAPARFDYTWASPNRKHLANGAYVPGRRAGTELPVLGILWDASGSMMDAQTQAQINGEINALSQMYPRRIVVLTHEEDVTDTFEWTPDDGDFALPSVKGGGGTSHLDAFAQLAKLPEQPEVILAFTDLYSEFPATPPEAPVLWIHNVEKPECAPEWGQFIDISSGPATR